MKNREALAGHFKELGFKVGVEVGVAQGYFAETICKQNPGVKLYCIDSWLPPKWDMFDIAKELLAPYDCTLIQDDSVNASQIFEDETMDFVYIDGDHAYEQVKLDIAAWTPKVKKGGIVSGHDYYFTRLDNMGVINAVNEYVKEHNYELAITDWDGKNPKKDERQHSWYFTK